MYATLISSIPPALPLRNAPLLEGSVEDKPLARRYGVNPNGAPGDERVRTPGGTVDWFPKAHWPQSCGPSREISLPTPGQRYFGWNDTNQSAFQAPELSNHSELGYDWNKSDKFGKATVPSQTSSSAKRGAPSILRPISPASIPLASSSNHGQDSIEEEAQESKREQWIIDNGRDIVWLHRLMDQAGQAYLKNGTDENFQRWENYRNTLNIILKYDVMCQQRGEIFMPDGYTAARDPVTVDSKGKSFMPGQVMHDGESKKLLGPRESLMERFRLATLAARARERKARKAEQAKEEQAVLTDKEVDGQAKEESAVSTENEMNGEVKEESAVLTDKDVNGQAKEESAILTYKEESAISTDQEAKKVETDCQERSTKDEEDAKS